MKNEKQIYEVDQAMLGHLFCGDFNDLKNFCEILEDVIDPQYLKNIEIVPIETYNGAKQSSEIFVLDSVLWNRAINKHVKAYPEAWAI